LTVFLDSHTMSVITPYFNRKFFYSYPTNNLFEDLPFLLLFSETFSEIPVPIFHSFFQKSATVALAIHGISFKKKLPAFSISFFTIAATQSASSALHSKTISSCTELINFISLVLLLRTDYPLLF
jgi:hypothetical protein